jgi:prepilin signal peptidase PulO-like enzyme (type II secretory pathway)
MLMIIALLVVFGLCLGSFVNALVWRLHEQAEESDKKKPSKKYLRDLSISKGRSMCPDCHHTLGAKDLVPVLSWLSLGGKCRYCRKPISAQYPVVELTTAVLFVLSYVYWPVELVGAAQIAVFSLWLILLVGFMALVVYDFKWMLLPDRIVFPLGVVAGVVAIINITASHQQARAALDVILAVAVGGGIFYLLYQVSGGRWIGGGDVKLGWLLGLVVGTPSKAILFIFLAALTGSLVSIPMMVGGKMSRGSVIPFGPFLIVGAVVAVLFGADILDWYRQTVLLGV